MSSQNFRHRESEGWQSENLPERQMPREASDQGTRENRAPDTPSTPHAPSKAPLFPEAVELGSAASLFRIAQSRTHPDPESALETLRIRMKKTVEDNSQARIPATTALRDRLSTTDSLWVPTLKAALVFLVCALLAAGIYAVIEWIEPVSAQPVATAGTAIATLLSL